MTKHVAHRHERLTGKHAELVHVVNLIGQSQPRSEQPRINERELIAPAIGRASDASHVVDGHPLPLLLSADVAPALVQGDERARRHLENFEIT